MELLADEPKMSAMLGDDADKSDDDDDGSCAPVLSEPRVSKKTSAPLACPCFFWQCSFILSLRLVAWLQYCYEATHR